MQSIEPTKEQFDEIEACLSNPNEVSQEVRYAMGALGIKYKEIKPKDISTFEGDDEEKEIKFNFFNQQRRVLLASIIEQRQKVIDQRLCDGTALEEEEEQHLNALLSAEDKKLQKIYSRQNKETKRLLNEQLANMSMHEKQRMIQEQELDKMQRKQGELHKIKQEKLKKKQQILARRRKAENSKQEKERKRYLKLLKKREENDRKFELEQMKKDQKKQAMLHQRVKEFHTKRVQKIEQDHLLESTQQSKMNNIAQRYGKENERYINGMKNRIKGVQFNYNQRKERHKASHSLYKKQLKAKHDALLKQQQENAKRLKEFQLQKEAELRRKKLKRDKQMKKTLCAAKGGEEARLKKIEEAGLRAMENREKFFKEKQREDHLKKLVANMKKQAAIDAATRQAQATAFKNEQLMLKNQREDNRRIKDLNLKQSLRQQRMMNDTAVKLRQNALKEEIMEANKKGDVGKLNALIQELGATDSKAESMMVTPSKKKLKNKISVTLSPRKVDSSIAKTNQMNVCKMKANIYRSSA